MTPIARYAALWAFALCSSVGQAGPIADAWNGLFGYGYYGPPAYQSPMYGYGYGYGYGQPVTYSAGYGVACDPCEVRSCGYACVPTCGTCTPSPCGVGCATCGSSSCGGNCTASAPSSVPTPDDPPKTFDESYDDAGDATDDGTIPRAGGAGEAPDPFELPPSAGDSATETRRPATGESAIPNPTPAPTPAPEVDEDAIEVEPLEPDDRITWRPTPRTARLAVSARFGSPRVARTRVTPAEWGTIPVSTRVAATER